MAATNPFRVSDLIAKYGWKVMPYLSNLGPMLLAEAQVLFVDSGHTNTLDADDTEHGHSFEKPLATIDYAIGLCTAAERSVILVAPGHVETLAAATVDFDVSDITCIGIGEGTNRPKVVFGNAASSVDIGANNVHLINLRFVPSITDVLIGVDIETTVTGTIIEDCEFAEGDDAADEFIDSIALKATCTDTKIKNCVLRTKVAAAGCLNAIKLTGVSDNVIIKGCRIIGNYLTAGIYNDSGACTDLLIDDCTMKVADGLPGISVVSTTTGIIRNVCIESTGLAVDSMIVAADMSWFNNYGVTADGTAAEIIGGGEVTAGIIAYNLDHLAKTADGGTNYPTQVTTDSILGMLMATAGDPSTFVKGTDSLQAIRDYVAGTTSLDGINLDHLALTAAGGTNYPTTVTAQSILGMIMGTTGDPATFVKGTDSLQAIADHVQTLMTTAVGSDVYPSGITNESILAYLMSKSTTPAASSYSNETDSLEMLSDKFGGFSGDGGAVQDDSVKASLDLAHTELTKIKDQAVGNGSTYFVDSTASDDTGDGLTWATAKKSIQAAVTLMTDHSTVYVAGVSYTEAVTLPANIERGRIIGVCKANQIPYWLSGAVDASHLVINRGEWEVANFRFASTSATVANVTISAAGSSSIIRDCWFAGNGSESGIEAVGPSGAATDIKILRCRFSGFTTTNAKEGAICGTNYDTQAAVCWEIIGNMFGDNTKNINLLALSCRIEGNTFTTTASASTPTVIISTRASAGVGGAGGGNAVVGNYFPNAIASITIANGYLGSTNDTWAGNYCPDGLTTGGTPVA